MSFEEEKAAVSMSPLALSLTKSMESLLGRFIEAI
jgi:hypothetical protein